MSFLDKVQGSLSGNANNGPASMPWRDPVLIPGQEDEINKKAQKAALERQAAFEKVWSEMSTEEKAAYEKASKDYRESAGEFSGDSMAVADLNTDRADHNFSDWFDGLSREEQLDYMMKNASVQLTVQKDSPDTEYAGPEIDHDLDQAYIDKAERDRKRNRTAWMSGSAYPAESEGDYTTVEELMRGHESGASADFPFDKVAAKRAASVHVDLGLPDEQETASKDEVSVDSQFGE